MRLLIKSFRIFLIGACLFTSTQGFAWNYPQTPKDPVIECLHGVEVVDSYRWLEDANDPRVAKWTAAQNKLTKDYLSNLPLRQPVHERLEQLARGETLSFKDVLEGTRRFVWLKKPENEHAIFYGREAPSAELQELLNPNQWAQGQKLDFAVPSRDGTYVAFGISSGGDECPDIKILHVDSGTVLADSLHGRRQGWPNGLVAWLPESEGFYYSAYPEPGEVAPSEAAYWSAVYYHRLGTTKENDVCVFSHPTIREASHWIQVTDDGRYLVLNRELANRNEIYLQPIGDHQANLIPLTVGLDANSSVAMAGDHIILLTDFEAPNYRAYLINPTCPCRDNWQELVPETNDRLLAVHGIAGYYFAEYLHNAYTVIKVLNAEGVPLHTIPLQSMGTASLSGYWSSPDVWVEFSSFVHPLLHYRYDCYRNALEPIEEGPKIVDPSRFIVEQVWYPSKDGTRISMFLIFDQTYGSRMPSRHGRPTLLAGYGGFGIPVTPLFLDLYIPFLEAGGLVAIPNLRGGGEYGEQWHKAGMLEKKQNVFDDFIAAAEWLTKKGYTSTGRLAIRGRSNGGLLVGAVMTQRPELFRAALCEVPLLDMVRYHQFGFSNIWSGEYGSSENVDQFQYLMRYSPYHQVVDGVKYPAVLIRGAENDARTDPLHARKMVARLQAADPQGYPKLCLIDKGAGHLGGTTVKQQVSQKVATLTFLMDQLGMNVGGADGRN